jgi:hypothetical protein
MLAAGGEHASDLDILRSSPGVFGQLPSNATVSRFFERTVANPELFSYGFETLTRELRTRAWDAAGNRSPAMTATAADPLIIDIDATLVTSHSDKENVAGTYKAATDSPRLSPAPITAPATAPEKSSPPCCVPATRERTALRTISASSTPPPPNCHRASTTEPGTWPGRQRVLAASPGPARAERTDAWVINATDVIPLTDYPPGTKLFLRAEPLHPGAQPTLLDVGGAPDHRVPDQLTALARTVPGRRAPGRGRCENRIKTLKNTGLGKLPFFDFVANQAWANIAALAFNLVSWIQLAALPDGHQAKAWDIKRWRYRLFTIAGKIITRARRNQLLLPETAPEKDPARLLLENTARLTKGLVPSTG